MGEGVEEEDMVRRILTDLSVGVLRPMTNPRTEVGSYIQGRESFM